VSVELLESPQQVTDDDDTRQHLSFIYGCESDSSRICPCSDRRTGNRLRGEGEGVETLGGPWPIAAVPAGYTVIRKPLSQSLTRDTAGLNETEDIKPAVGS
jgi:hypothetical protein